MSTKIPPEMLQNIWDRSASVATTSGTSVTLASGLADRDEIDIWLEGVSTSGTDDLLVQIGDSGGFHTTGYSARAQSNATGGADDVTSTTGFILGDTFVAASAYTVRVQIVHLGGFKYGYEAKGLLSDGTVLHLGLGTVTLDTEVTQVRLTTSGGSDTFDAGAAYIRHR